MFVHACTYECTQHDTKTKEDEMLFSFFFFKPIREEREDCLEKLKEKKYAGSKFEPEPITSFFTTISLALYTIYLIEN